MGFFGMTLSVDSIDLLGAGGSSAVVWNGRNLLVIVEQAAFAIEIEFVVKSLKAET